MSFGWKKKNRIIVTALELCRSVRQVIGGLTAGLKTVGCLTSGAFTSAGSIQLSTVPVSKLNGTHANERCGKMFVLRELSDLC